MRYDEITPKKAKSGGIMRIGIDIRCLSDGKRTGVEEYTVNILENIFQLDHKNDYVLFLNFYDDVRCDLEVFAKYKNVSIQKFSYPNKLLNFFFWYLNWPKVDLMLGGLDIFFMPNINFNTKESQMRGIITKWHHWGNV